MSLAGGLICSHLLLEFLNKVVSNARFSARIRTCGGQARFNSIDTDHSQDVQEEDTNEGCPPMPGLALEEYPAETSSLQYCSVVG